MSDRIVEVEWEDTLGSHGWQPRVTWPVEDGGRCLTVGYVRQDGKRGIVLGNGDLLNWEGEHRDDCALFIPRSAIRKVTELSRKRPRPAKL